MNNKLNFYIFSLFCTLNIQAFDASKKAPLQVTIKKRKLSAEQLIKINKFEQSQKKECSIVELIKNNDIEKIKFLLQTIPLRPTFESYGKEIFECAAKFGKEQEIVNILDDSGFIDNIPFQLIADLLGLQLFNIFELVYSKFKSKAHPLELIELNRFILFNSFKQGILFGLDYLLTDAVIMQTDAYGNTLLHMAALGGNLDIVKILLEKKPDLLSINNNLSETPLHFACISLNFDIIILLLGKKPDLIYSFSKNKHTVLDYICASDPTFSREYIIKIIDFLLSKNSNLINHHLNLQAIIMRSHYDPFSNIISKRNVRAMAYLLSLNPNYVNIFEGLGGLTDIFKISNEIIQELERYQIDIIKHIESVSYIKFDIFPTLLLLSIGSYNPDFNMYRAHFHFDSIEVTFKKKTLPEYLKNVSYTQPKELKKIFNIEEYIANNFDILQTYLEIKKHLANNIFNHIYLLKQWVENYKTYNYSYKLLNLFSYDSLFLILDKIRKEKNRTHLHSFIELLSLEFTLADIVDDSGNNLLHYAINHNDVNLINLLMIISGEQSKHMLFKKNDAEITPLFMLINNKYYLFKDIILSLDPA